MTTRQLSAVAVVVLGIAVCDATRATAEDGGTVTWAAGYPVANASQMMGMIPGSVDVFGSYTTNQGWAPVSGNFTWTPAAGGPLSSVVLDIGNGKIGKLNNGQIGAARVTLGKGSYQGWLTMAYTKLDGTGSIVISTVVQFTIN